MQPESSNDAQGSKVARNLLGFVVVGALVAGGIYYFFAGDGQPPVKPAAAESAAPPAAAPQVTPQAVPAPSSAASDDAPAESAARDAQETLKQIEAQQRQEEKMMEKPKIPADDESNDVPTMEGDPPKKKPTE